MLYTFITSIISGVAALFYPSYACYKLLSRRPCPEELLEKWLMYWAVLGSCFLIEVVAYPILIWIPFYHTFRTIFLVSLAVNDGHLASFLYAGVLVPFLTEHEQLIDSQLAALKPQITEFFRDMANKLWRLLQSYIAQEQQQIAAGVGGGNPQAPPPTMADPVSGPAAAVWGLVRQYAPVAVAGLSAAFTGPAATPPTHGGQGQPLQGYVTDPHTLRERRAQLEAELAALAATGAPVTTNPSQSAGGLTGYFARAGGVAATTGMSASPSSVPLPAGGRTPYDAPPATSRHGSAESLNAAGSMRTRTPYDSEDERQRGYDILRRDEVEPFVGGFVAPGSAPGASGGQPPQMQQRQSWWGWATSAPEGQGYQRVGGEEAKKE